MNAEVEPSVVGMRWVKTVEGEDVWWDYVKVYSNGDTGSYEVGYREDGDSGWKVAYNYADADGNVTPDLFIPRTDYPTYQSLRKMLRMQYLLTRCSDGEG